jgi:hypothetical protein
MTLIAENVAVLVTVAVSALPTLLDDVAVLVTVTSGFPTRLDDRRRRGDGRL